MIFAFDPVGGSNAASGTGADYAAAWTNRVQGRSTLLGLISANAGPHEVIGAELTHRYLANWSLTTGTHLNFSGANAQGIVLRSAHAVGISANPLILADWKRTTTTGDWVDTGTTTTRGMPIWRLDNAVGAGGYAVRRVRACDFTTAMAGAKELWEGGANYTTTFSSIHPNLDRVPGLDVLGTCWTSYDAAGALSTSLYMACPANPVTYYGAISWLTNESWAVLGSVGLSGVYIDRSVELWGGGQKTVDVYQPGATGAMSKIRPKTRYSHPYAPIYRVDDAARAVWISLDNDPMYPHEVPVYPGGTGHSTGSSNVVYLPPTCEQASATGHLEDGGIPGVIVAPDTVEGVRSYSADAFHCTGLSNDPPSGGRLHQYNTQSGTDLNNARTKYGRGWAVGGPAAQVRFNRCYGNRGYEQPTQWQINGADSDARWNYISNKPSFGNGYVHPWGGTSNKQDTATGFACYTATGVELVRITIAENFFDCIDGGYSVDEFNSVAIGGFVNFSNNVIRLQARGGFTNAIVTTPKSWRYSVMNDAGEAQIYQSGEAFVGFSGASVWRFKAAPAVNAAAAPDAALATSRGGGYRAFAGLEAYRLAGNLLPHIPGARRRP